MEFRLTSPVGPAYPTAVGNSFGTFTTRQDVSPQPWPTLYPADMRTGLKVKLEAEGEMSSTGTPTLVLGFYIGTTPGTVTTVLAETGAQTISTGAAWPWRMEWRGIIVALGSAGSCVGMGDCEVGTSLTAFTSVSIPTTQALRTVTWNTTVANSIGVCATWSASSASNTVRVNNFSALLLN